MRKRGQVTVFIVIGIVILALAGGIFYIVSVFSEEKLGAERQEGEVLAQFQDPLYSFVSGCLQQVAENAVHAVSIQGGVADPAKTDSLHTSTTVVAFSYKDSAKLLSKSKVEKELGAYVDAHIHKCAEQGTTNFVTPLQISYGDARTDVTIADTQVKFILQMDVEATNEQGESTTLTRFAAALNYRLGLLLQNIDQIIETQQKSPSWDTQLLAFYEPYIIVFPYDDRTTILSLYDVQGKQPLTFVTALELEAANAPPQLGYISDKVLVKGQPFQLVVTASDADGDTVTFSTDSDDVIVIVDAESGEGVLQFTPQNSGIFFVTVSVEDSAGATDSQQVRFVVE